MLLYLVKYLVFEFKKSTEALEILSQSQFSKRENSLRVISSQMNPDLNICMLLRSTYHCGL